MHRGNPGYPETAREPRSSNEHNKHRNTNGNSAGFCLRPQTTSNRKEKDDSTFCSDPSAARCMLGRVGSLVYELGRGNCPQTRRGWTASYRLKPLNKQTLLSSLPLFLFVLCRHHSLFPSFIYSHSRSFLSVTFAHLRPLTRFSSSLTSEHSELRRKTDSYRAEKMQRAERPVQRQADTPTHTDTKNRQFRLIVL